MFWIIFVATIVVLSLIAVVGVRREKRKLLQAPKGSVRVVTKSGRWANQTAQQYADFGWKLVRQTNEKSRGSRGQVTMTFRKK